MFSQKYFRLKVRIVIILGMTNIIILLIKIALIRIR